MAIKYGLFQSREGLWVGKSDGNPDPSGSPAVWPVAYVGSEEYGREIIAALMKKVKGA